MCVFPSLYYFIISHTWSVYLEPDPYPVIALASLSIHCWCVMKAAVFIVWTMLVASPSPCHSYKFLLRFDITVFVNALQFSKNNKSTIITLLMFAFGKNCYVVFGSIYTLKVIYLIKASSLNNAYQLTAATFFNVPPSFLTRLLFV